VGLRTAQTGLAAVRRSKLNGMAAVLGVWIGLAGAVAALTGVAGLRRHRWLRRHGAKAWDDGGQLVALEYPLPPGHSVLIWYDPAGPAADPASPGETLAYGRRGWPVNVAFVAIGAVLETFAVAIGVLGA
jgi:hypothetical protein